MYIFTYIYIYICIYIYTHCIYIYVYTYTYMLHGLSNKTGVGCPAPSKRSRASAEPAVFRGLSRVRGTRRSQASDLVGSFWFQTAKWSHRANRMDSPVSLWGLASAEAGASAAAGARDSYHLVPKQPVLRSS